MALRAPSTIRRTPTASTRRPATRSPIASHGRKFASAPMLTSAATPSEPSAFMSRIVHSPDSVFQVATARRISKAEAAQKACSPGGPEGSAPANPEADAERVEVDVAHLGPLDAV